MTEVDVDAHAVKKRRLPLWMVKANSANEIRKCGEGDRSCSRSEEKPDAKDARTELKSTTRMRKSKPTRSIEKLSESCTVGSSKDRQRKRKASTSLTNHGVSKTSIQEAEGGPTTVDNGATTKTRGRKSKRTKNDEMVCSSINDNEVELTVDDLVHIAEEYVNADRQKQLQCSNAREQIYERSPKSSLISTTVSRAAPLQPSGSNQALSRCTTMSNSNSSALEEKNRNTEILTTDIPRTGDAAQDMLDLLLGPLLKKPKSEEHVKQAVDIESMILAHKHNKPSTSRKEILKGEALPTKRKSSLKDKVAILLG
ncbi:hypothetical protein Cni_G18546 [Canna indica]|uniref:Uncharacterized protein n=1 Tax=Canna indica TaxID=4628 RepID=A0AAQ3QHS4_9LILI|nr:hypothetical protein Cni_G18546 [Canna indica]